MRERKKNCMQCTMFVCVLIMCTPTSTPCNNILPWLWKYSLQTYVIPSLILLHMTLECFHSKGFHNGENPCIWYTCKAWDVLKNSFGGHQTSIYAWTRTKRRTILDVFSFCVKYSDKQTDIQSDKQTDGIIFISRLLGLLWSREIKQGDMDHMNNYSHKVRSYIIHDCGKWNYQNW